MLLSFPYLKNNARIVHLNAMQFERAKAYILPKLERELAKHLSYHSVGHVRDVYQAAERMAKAEGVSPYDTKLLLTAVLFHDAGFLVRPKEHEKISCKMVKETLPRFNYTDEEIKRICGMIMATRIPQTPRNLLEQIICDADLDYLGRDDFFAIGNRLFAEMMVYGVVGNELEWNRLQVKFLESHDYFTKTAIRLRKPNKDRYVKELQRKIKRLSAKG